MIIYIAYIVSWLVFVAVVAYMALRTRRVERKFRHTMRAMDAVIERRVAKGSGTAPAVRPSNGARARA